MSAKSEPLPAWGSAFAGATGAVLANSLVYPLDIVKTRMQVQGPRKPLDAKSLSNAPTDHYDSTLDAMNKIIAEDGLSGLYSGINGALLGVASTNFAYFYWYSIVRTLYSSSFAGSKSPTQRSTAVELSLGAIAGAIAQVFTIPVSVITTRQQTQYKSDGRGFLETGKDVINSDDGVTGLWRGLKASLVLVINPAVTYGAYQRLRQALFPQRINLRPWEAFFLGALSKALATILTQPLIVAKVGLQSRPPPERQGKPFKTFIEVMRYIVRNEGALGLFKGLGPQILKGLLVQGILMTIKERMELVFVVLFAYVRAIRDKQIKEAVIAVKASTAKASEKVAGASSTTIQQGVQSASSLTEQASAVLKGASASAQKVLPVVQK